MPKLNSLLCSLDKDFDYDNCPLTRREWPYNRAQTILPQKPIA